MIWSLATIQTRQVGMYEISQFNNQPKFLTMTQMTLTGPNPCAKHQEIQNFQSDLQVIRQNNIQPRRNYW